MGAGGWLGKGCVLRWDDGGLRESIAEHDEGAAWCHRVAGEIKWTPVDPVICRDGRLIRVRSHHVERKFCLWYEFVPDRS